MLTQTSTHVASLTEGEIVVESDLGSIRRVTIDNLPILKGLSIKRLLINPGAMRTPHWHANANANANANELTYCVSGSALVSVLDSGSKFASFVVRTGDMFHIDSGSLHHIENIGVVGQHLRPAALGFRGDAPQHH
jgi:oxalate decarboxylase